MQLHFNFFNVLILTGCVQGIILGLLLFFRKNRKLTHVFLGILLVGYSLNNLNAVFFDTGLSLQVPALLVCPFSLILAIGPALYLHTKFALRPETAWRNGYLWHFLPVLAEFAWYASLSFWFLGKPQALLQFYHLYENWYSLPEQIAGIISVLVYLVLTLKILGQHHQLLKENFSAILDATYKRLQLLVVLLAIGWLAWLVLVVIDAAYFGFGLAQYVYYPLYIIMSVTIYAIGYSGYFREVVVVEFTRPASEPVIKGTDPEQQEIAGKLVAIMERQLLYTDPQLRLKAVADAIGCSPQKLSASLNNVLGKNFYDFVNGYRLEEIKRKLANPAYNSYTISSLSFDCGFNSKSTFNELFKKHTGQTPKEYKSMAQNDVRMMHTDISKAANP